MNEEEKETIEKLDYELTNSYVHNQGISKETLKLFKDIIEKQQKEIKARLEEIETLKESQFVLYGDNGKIVGVLKYPDDVIRKEKIKEKIEEKIKELESHIWKDGYMTKFDRYAIHYLKELLGE